MPSRDPGGNELPQADRRPQMVGPVNQLADALPGCLSTS
jgi:hypothetical protein